MSEAALADRLARAERSAQKKLFADLGVADREGFTALKDQRAAERSDYDNLQIEHNRIKQEHEALSQRVAEGDAYKARTKKAAALDDAIAMERQSSKDKEGKESPGREVFSREQTHALLKGQLDYIDGKVVVLGEDGKPDPKRDVHALLKGFLDANPNQVKSTAQGGTGAAPAPGHRPPPPDPKKPRSREERTAQFMENMRGGR